jgi:hypothetical protein
MVSREALLGHWVHSHEEDTEGVRVFRPRSFSFPPSRGREELELEPDGSSVARRPGPVDVPEEATGTWELEGQTLRLTAGEEERSLLVIAADADKLVVGA